MKRSKKIVATLMGIACLGCLAGGVYTMDNSYNVSSQIHAEADSTDGVYTTLAAGATISFNSEDHIANWINSNVELEFDTEGYAQGISFSLFGNRPSGTGKLSKYICSYKDGDTYYLGCGNDDTERQGTGKLTKSTITDIGNNVFHWKIVLNELKAYQDNSAYATSTVTGLNNVAGGSVKIMNLKIGGYKTLAAGGTISLNSEDYIANWINSNKCLEFDTEGYAQGISFSLFGNRPSGTGKLSKYICSYKDGDSYYLGCGDNDTDRTGSGKLTKSTITDMGDGVFHWKIVLNELSAYQGNNNYAVGTVTGLNNVAGGSVNIKNLTVTEEDAYDPTKEQGVILLSAGKSTEIPDVANWGNSVISFDVYHDSLDQDVDPQFMFVKKGTDDGVTDFFGYKNIGGETALYVRTSGTVGYWVKTTTQPVALENGWYRWTINLAELKEYNSNGTETIGKIWNRGSKDVYIKNVQVTTYDPSKEANITLATSGNTELKWGEENAYVNDWFLTPTTLKLKVYGVPQAVSGKTLEWSFGSTSSDRICEKFNFGADGKLVGASSSNRGNEVGTYTALSGADRGWYEVSIDCQKIGVYSDGAYIALRYIRVANMATPVYVKDITVEQGNAVCDTQVLKSGCIALDTAIDNWMFKTISFKTYSNIVEVGLSNNGTSNNLSAKIFKDSAGVTCTAITEEAGWYSWTVDLSKITKTGTGLETATHLFVNMPKYDYSVVFVKDIAVQTTAIKTIGASIRIAEVSNIRFGSQIDSTIYSALTANATNVKYGTLISTTESEFTLETEGVINNESSAFIDEESNLYTAIYSGISSTDNINARAYVSFTVGGETYVVYGDVITRSVSEIAGKALADSNANYSEDERAILSALKGE